MPAALAGRSSVGSTEEEVEGNVVDRVPSGVCRHVSCTLLRRPKARNEQDEGYGELERRSLGLSVS